MTTFTATLQQAGRTATGIVVPDAVVAALGAGRRPAVVATLGTYRYRSALGVRDGVAKLPVSAEHRARAGLAAGDEVEVTLAVDTEPRTVEPPADLHAAREHVPGGALGFAAVAPRRRWGFVTALEGAKAPATRERRLTKALLDLTAVAV